MDQPCGSEFATDAIGRAYRTVFALSATVTDDRITDVLGADAAIWAIEAEQPHNDIMKRPADLAEFRRLARSIFNTIKARHGEQAVINIFPAMPVSAAVKVGRVWMPKADLPLVVFDQNRTLQGLYAPLRSAVRDLGRPQREVHSGIFPVPHR